ncbi:MAG: EamA-like transporter family protein [Candidatus Lokiarchaeum sp. GC14_75]|nr:MAG: EamA-like transporter family protein [Candidatus Lokiarchaeum sp. GC14_75]
MFRLILFLSRYIPTFQNLLRILRFFTSPPSRHSMQLLEIALEDYHLNNMKSKLMQYKNSLQKEYNEKLEFDLSIYFRKWEDLFPIEKKLIDLSYGKILDIGSCTGYYIPHLMKKGTTTGIEISSKINNIARINGINNYFWFLLIGLNYGFGLLFWYKTISYLEMGKAMILVSFSSIVSAIFGTIFLGELFTYFNLAGMVIMIISTITIVREKNKLTD